MIADWATAPAIAWSEEPKRVEIPGTSLPVPVVSYSVADRLWTLHNRVPLHTREKGKVVVLEGFRFDLSSVPRAAWWLCAPFELSILAPVGHDPLYQTGGGANPNGFLEVDELWTRDETDRLFRGSMIAEAVPKLRATPAYNAVHLFGRHAWKG